SRWGEQEVGSMDVARIAVLGAGTMGHGIAQVAAMAGFQVMVRDVAEEVLARGREQIHWSLDSLVRKGRLAEEAAAAAKARIGATTDLAEAVGEAGLVIEAVPEDLDLKLQVFAEVDCLAPARTVIV